MAGVSVKIEPAAAAVAPAVMPIIMPIIMLITRLIAIKMRYALERLRLFIFVQPPQAQIITKTNPITGRHIRRSIPTYPQVVIGSYLLPFAGASSEGAAAGAGAEACV